MLQQGQKIKIVYSRQLLELGLCELVTREAMVTQVLYVKKSKRIKGVYAIPQSGRLKNEEWYIPIQSVDNVLRNQKKDAYKLMKTTIL